MIRSDKILQNAIMGIFDLMREVVSSSEKLFIEQNTKIDSLRTDLEKLQAQVKAKQYGESA